MEMDIQPHATRSRRRAQNAPRVAVGSQVRTDTAGDGIPCRLAAASTLEATTKSRFVVLLTRVATMKLAALLVVAGFGSAHGFHVGVGHGVRAVAHQHRIHAPPVAAEYSTKAKIMAETRAPLRQARIFFLYPSSIAGAGLGSYVSLLRAIGQDDLFKDLGNLAVNFGVIAVAIFLLRADL